MKRHRLVAVIAVAAIGLATNASAQQSAAAVWHKGTALSIFGGGASASGTDGAVGAAGGAIGWEFAPRFTLEGSGIWYPNRDPDVFSALMAAKVNLVPPRGVVPFVSGGIGLHRIDTRGAAFTRTVSDFAVAFGGGIDIYVRQHLALRPDVRVFLVPGDGDTRTVAAYGVHLVYHFEEHPITP